MEQIIDKKPDLKDSILFFLKKNKLKIYILASIIFTLILIFLVLSENKKNENIFISENYVKAGLLVSSGQKDEAKKFYENIIMSDNKFYSLLSLNTVLEKNLIEDSEKILEYFAQLEKKNFSEDLKDLILFKKALYLIKIKDPESGKKILENLIKNDSTLKLPAQEIIK